MGLGTGLIAYGAALAVTMPARAFGMVLTLPEKVRSVSGTVWNGAATLSDGFVARWQVAPWRSILSASSQGSWTLRGPQTRLDGQVEIEGAHWALSEVSGYVGWDVVEAALPGLPFHCDPVAEVSLERIRMSNMLAAEGEIISEPGRCADDEGAVAVPALFAQLSFESDALLLTVHPLAMRTTTLGHLKLRANTLIVTIEPAGARLVPGMPTSGPTVFEMPIALTSPIPQDRLARR